MNFNIQVYKVASTKTYNIELVKSLYLNTQTSFTANANNFIKIKIFRQMCVSFLTLWGAIIAKKFEDMGQNKKIYIIYRKRYAVDEFSSEIKIIIINNRT